MSPACLGNNTATAPTKFGVQSSLCSQCVIADCFALWIHKSDTPPPAPVQATLYCAPCASANFLIPLVSQQDHTVLYSRDEGLASAQVVSVTPPHCLSSVTLPPGTIDLFPGANQVQLRVPSSLQRSAPQIRMHAGTRTHNQGTEYSNRG